MHHREAAGAVPRVEASVPAGDGGHAATVAHARRHRLGRRRRHGRAHPHRPRGRGRHDPAAPGRPGGCGPADPQADHRLEPCSLPDAAPDTAVGLVPRCRLRVARARRLGAGVLRRRLGRISARVRPPRESRPRTGHRRPLRPGGGMDPRADPRRAVVASPAAARARVVRHAPLDRVQRRSGPPGGVRPGVQRDRPGSPLGGACARGAQRVRAAPGTRRKAVSGRSADAALPGPDDLRAQRGRGRALRGARLPPGPGRPPRRAASHRGPLRRRRRAAGIPHERDGHGLRPAHRGRSSRTAMS